MNVYKCVCPNDGSEYIVNESKFFCVDCGGLCNVVSEGKNELLPNGIDKMILESGAVKIVYKDGKKVVVKVRKKKKSIATPAQKEALKKARLKAHTPDADKKRRKSMNARRDAGLIGEGVDENNNVYSIGGEVMGISKEEVMEIVEAVVEVLEAKKKKGKKVCKKEVEEVEEEDEDLEDEEEEEEEVDETRIEKVVRGGQVVKIKRPNIKKKMSAKQKAALKKARMKAHTGFAQKKRAKSMKLRARKIGESVMLNVGVGCLVSESFDIVLENKQTISIEKDYMLDVYDVTESVVAMDIYNEEGELVQEGVEVDAEFVGNIYKENLVESLEDYGVQLNDVFEEETQETQETQEVKEGKSILSYNTNDGFVAVVEGKSFKLGNRVRARAFLVSEGVEVVSGLLDSVIDGKDFKIK